MTYIRRLVILAVCWTGLIPAGAHAEPRVYRPISLSVVYPLTTFVRTDPIIAGLSLNLLDGGHRAVYGLEVGVLVNRERERMAGVQIAGATNVVLGDLRGLQIAGGVNVVLRSSKGIQLSGLWNHASSVWTPKESGFQGLQISAVGNSADLAAGIQLATVVNTAGQMDGLQVGFVNLVYIKMNGLQLGFANFQLRGGVIPDEPDVDSAAPGAASQRAPEVVGLLYKRFSPLSQLLDNRSHLVQLGLVNGAVNLIGAQLSVMVNVDIRARGFLMSWFGNYVLSTMHGAQFSFTVNYAGTYVEGVQFALVNICDSLRGVQLGVFNFCGRVRGVQVGAINIAYRNKVPFMPGVNIGL